MYSKISDINALLLLDFEKKLLQALIEPTLFFQNCEADPLVLVHKVWIYKKHHDKKHHDEKHHDRTTFVRDIASLDQDHLQGVQVILE